MIKGNRQDWRTDAQKGPPFTRGLLSALQHGTDFCHIFILRRIFTQWSRERLWVVQGDALLPCPGLEQSVRRCALPGAHRGSSVPTAVLSLHSVQTSTSLPELPKGHSFQSSPSSERAVSAVHHHPPSAGRLCAASCYGWHQKDKPENHHGRGVPSWLRRWNLSDDYVSSSTEWWRVQRDRM